MNQPVSSAFFNGVACTQQELRQQLLSREGLCKRVEQNCSISQYVRIGYQVYAAGEHYVVMVKPAAETRLEGLAAFAPSGSNPEEIDFRAVIVAPDGARFEESYVPDVSARWIETILFGIFEAYLEGFTSRRDIKEIFERYRKRDTKNIGNDFLKTA